MSVPELQIDLLIERSDRAITICAICEIRFSEDVFEMTPGYKEEIQRKVTVFRRRTTTRRQIFTTLITSCGARENDSYLAYIDNQVVADAFSFEGFPCVRARTINGRCLEFGLQTERSSRQGVPMVLAGRAPIQKWSMAIDYFLPFIVYYYFW